MKIKQNLSWHKTGYLNMKKWIAKKSPHYIFYYFENSLAEKRIDEIIKIQEQSYEKISKKLEAKNRRVIEYFFYPSKRIKKKLMGDEGNGNAIWSEIKKEKKIWKPKKFEVHALYNKKTQCVGAHEDTHLLSSYLGVAIFLFCEGLSEFMSEKWQGKDLDFWAKKYLDENKLYSIKFLVDNKNWDNVDDLIVYPQAGSFVRFLIESYGIKKFKDVYQRLSRLNSYEDNLDIIRKRYFKELDKLEKEWKIKITS
jgi:hypothetical protein